MSGSTGIGQVIGGVIGFFTGGIGYIGLGVALGGLAGSLLEPTRKTESGRIDDLKVSVSQYGAGIPETWGTSMPPATWIWATDIIELGQTQSAGKGGGAEHTTYRQYIHGYISLGKSPPPGTTASIRKVLVDGKLVYDASSGLSVGQALATEENPFTTLQFYDGNESQLPHGIMEFYEGIGNVPAYRGIMGVFLIALECPGGRIPQLAFEVCMDAEESVEIKEGSWFTPQASGTFIHKISRISNDPVTLFTERPVTGGAYPRRRVDVYALDFGFLTPVNSFVMDWSFQHVSGPGIADIDAILVRGVDAQTGVDSGKNILYMKSGGFITYYPDFYVAGAQMLWSKHGDRLVMSNPLSGSPGIRRAALFHFERPFPIASMESDEVIRQIIVSPTVVWFWMGATLHARNRDDLTLIAQASVPAAWLSGVHFVALEDGSLRALANLNFVNSYLYTCRVDGVSVSIHLDATLPFLSGFTTTPSATLSSGRRVITDTLWNSVVDVRRVAIILGGLSPGMASIREIIENQTSRSGLDPLQVDVSTIDDEIWGYTFNKTPASPRSNIAPLLTYSGLGMVEEDGLIRFFHRGDKTSSGLIEYDDLGAFEDGQDPGDPFPLTRTQEDECPRSVTVSYVNPTFDYQTSTETARRIVADSELDEQVTLDLAMTPDRAATIAHRILYERWIGRQTRAFKVSRKYANMSAGDVRTIEYPRGTTSAWMLSKVTDTGALIECECFPADAELTTQTIPGSNGYTGQQMAPLAPPAVLTVVDSAILRDADNNAGVYAAMAGMGPGWPGGELFAGDDENDLQSRGSVLSEAVQGMCTSTLANYTLGNVDEHNILNVDIGHGELSTVSRDAILNGSQNVAAIGAHGRWEIIQFQRASETAPGRFSLSGLLRGLQGTEWAASQHIGGDRFVLLSGGGVLRPVFDVGSIGLNKIYRPVTNTRRFDSAQSQSQTFLGEGLRPLSPTTLRKSFSTNDITLGWRRRTRLSDQWWMGNVPLGEEAEEYQVDIFASNAFTTVVRTLSSLTRTVTYTSAQQIADFGSNQTTVHVRVYQISGTVGRGHPLEQSI